VVAAYDVGPFGFLEAPDRAMLPVRDGHVLPESILDRFRADEPKPGVPLLVGSNSLEGSMLQVSLAMHGVADWPGWARQHFGPAAGNAIEGLYLRGHYPHVSQAAGELLADAVFNCRTRRLIGLAHAAGKPVYVYRFDYPTSLFPGALHGADIPFVFRNVDALPGSREYRASRSMAVYWTNFARTGDPNGGTEERWEAWPASFLEIRKRLTPAQAKPAGDYMAWSDAGDWRDDAPDPLKTKNVLCDVWDAQIDPLSRPDR
jgi:para-nitrobenzyl esterase